MYPENFTPPTHPPPFLNEHQVAQLAQNGSLPISLPAPILTSFKELLQSSSQFFSQPTTSKETQYPSAEGTELGYYHIPQEKEYITYRHQPTSSTPLDQTSIKFWSFAASLLHRILCDLSRSLSIPLSAWDPLLNGCLSMPVSKQGTTPTLLRLFDYFPGSGAAEKHTDTGLLTLCIGTAPGLQVWSRDSPTSPPNEGKWLDVATQPTILIGKTLQWLSGGRLRAGLHRVVANPEGRQSVVFALRPSLRTRYFDLAPFGEPRVVDIVGVWQGIRGSVYNVNAQTGIREGQKERMRANGLLRDHEADEKDCKSKRSESGSKGINNEVGPGYG